MTTIIDKGPVDAFIAICHDIPIAGGLAWLDADADWAGQSLRSGAVGRVGLAERAADLRGHSGTGSLLHPAPDGLTTAAGGGYPFPAGL